MFKAPTMLACAALACPAMAQSASVTLDAPSTTVSSGQTVTVTVSADYDLMGAGGGVFGNAGFYGFGGDVLLDVPGSLVISNVTIASELSFGQNTGSTGSNGIAHVGGGSTPQTTQSADPATLLTFDVTAAPDAEAGNVTLDFAGTVMIVADDTLLSVSTDPGVGQTMLTTTSLTLTIAPACPADLNGDGSLNNTDINLFVNAFLTQSPSADFNGDGSYNNTDINLFVNAFLAGCP